MMTQKPATASGDGATSNPFDRIPDLVVELDEAGRLRRVNASFCNLFGGTPDSWRAQTFALQTDVSAGPCPGENTGNGCGGEAVYRTVKGERWIAWRAGDTAGVFAGRDVTAEHRYRRQLEDAQQSARQTAEAKSAFLAAMSHEIRTPLNGVLGMARLLLDTNLNPEQRSYAEAIDQSGDALLSILNDILDYSKIEAGKVELLEEPFNIAATVQEVIELLSPRAHEKDIEIAGAIQSDAARTVIGDAGRFRQVVLNLVNNAIKFTERGGVLIRVEMIVSTANKCTVRLEVRDTGIGVPEQKRATIFEEFAQAHGSRANKYGGTGLGLAICRKLVSAMSGKIGLQPLDQGGSLFWCEVPFTLADTSIDLGDATKGEGKLLGLKTMIISSCATTAEAVSTQLADAHADIVTVPDSGRALRMIGAGEAGNITTLIYDMKDAEDASIFAHRLARVPDQSCRALVLLRPTQRGLIDTLLRRGFHGYLIKPLRQRSLIERIRYIHGLLETEADIVLMTDEMDAEKHATRPHPARHRRILVAEDNAINKALIVALLKKAGHDAEAVENGKEVLSALDTADYDLVLMDIRMPEMDGLEATRRIRRSAKPYARLPVVALTADATEEDRSACLSAGMDDFITKPIDPAQLNRLIERWTNAPADAKLTPKQIASKSR